MGVVVPNNYYNGGTRCRRQQYKGGHDGSNIEEITYFSPSTCHIDVNNLPIMPANSSSSSKSSQQHWCVNQNNKLQFPPFCFDENFAMEASAAAGNESKIQLPYSEEATITSNKLFVIASLLAQCGDIESNPGPKPKKGAEPKPDPQKIMEDKVG